MADNIWLGGTSSHLTDISYTTNWSLNALPVDGDDVFFIPNPNGGSTYDADAGLSTLSTITLNSLNIANGSGKIGSAAAYLQVSAGTVNIGYSTTGSSLAASQSGATRIKVDLGSVQAAINILGSSTTSSDPSLGPIQILGTHASNTLNMLGGIASIAASPGEVSTLATINAAGTGTNLTLGEGVTLTNVTSSATMLVINSACPTLTLQSGTAIVNGTGTLTSATVNGGTAVFNTSGTITTLNVAAGTASFAQNPNARTVTNCNILAATASLNINNGVKGSITFTNPINPGNFQAENALTTVPGTKFQFS